MAKILLVEDDNNLREIYEARLQAEGYEIVSAPDGEAALVVAKKEMPDLVISDVMMPRISGFEMLDIMRNTDGLKDVKVIMLTALGQAEDKTRADNLGADKYLVKSQVTLEDIVKSAAELLGDDTAAQAVPAAAPAAVQAMPLATPPAPAPVTMPATTPTASTQPVALTQPVAPVVPAPAPSPAPMFTPTQPAPVPEPTTTPPAAPIAAPIAPEPMQTQPIVAPTPVAEPQAAPAPVMPTNDSQLADAVNNLIAGTPTATPVLASEPLQPVAPVATPPVPVEPATSVPAEPIAPVGPLPQPAPTLNPTMPAPTFTPPQAPTTPVEPPVPVEPPAVPAMPPVPAMPQPQTPVDDTVGIANKKIIQPLDPSVGAPERLDLNALLAKEGHSLEDQPTGTADAHPPGHVISPNPTGADGKPLDPNSIAL
jgi:CheY-like chemotaxis protein